jgi:hypothetical protein
LAAQLQTVSDLVHFGLANAFSAHEDLALTMGATDADTTFADTGEYGIPIRIIDELTSAGFAKIINCGTDVIS